jgi:hypothetical protein
MTSFTQVIISGPLAAGAVPHAVDAAVLETLDYVSTQALADVHYVLDRSIQHPTPYYETQINRKREHQDAFSVNDRGVIYGPWLEGVSSRNQTTRFKGYAAFRRATQEAERYAPIVALRMIIKHLTGLA